MSEGRGNCGTCACYAAVEGQCHAQPPRQFLVPAPMTPEKLKAVQISGHAPQPDYHVIAAWPPVQVDQWCASWTFDPALPRQ